MDLFSLAVRFPIHPFLPLPFSLPCANTVPFWKARFGAECVSAVVQGTLTSRAPKYSIILDLDRKVRDMEVPLYAQQVLAASGAGAVVGAELGVAAPGAGALVVDTSLGLGETMSRFMPINYRELSAFFPFLFFKASNSRL